MPGSVPLALGLDTAGVQVPWYFRCPISLELMRDPVTVSTGQTYDRASIESWVATGNTTCPVTRSPLDRAFTLIPNHTLRRLIQDWCVAHRSLGVERIPTPKQPADPDLIRSLLAQCPALPPLRKLRALARDSDKNRLGGCSERAKRKAQHLLKLLRSAWPAADSIANSDDFLQPY
uniref:U-box domain-containing protein n=1 Tax=Oryza barthii TaxID=65489 RepID=A0A0D3F681_9ORYZ